MFCTFILQSTEPIYVDIIAVTSSCFCPVNGFALPT